MTDKITFYHGTPVGGLKVLTAKKPENFDKEKRVYLTSLYPMALIYGVKNFEYTYGYTIGGEIYFDEYFEGAFEKLYDDERISEITGIVNGSHSATF